MALAGALEIQLFANIARLQADMDRATRTVGGAMSTIERSVGGAMKMLGGLAAGLSVAAFAGWVKGAVDASDSLNDLSKSTRIAIGDLAGLKLAAQQSGGDLAGAADAINKLSVNIGKDTEKFAKLGITAKEPLEAFKQLADVFSAIEDPQIRAALGAATLGKSWASAAPMLAEGGARIGEMIAKGKDLSGATQAMADEADKFNDSMAELGMTMEGFKTKVVGDMLPGMNSIATAMKMAYEESGLLKSAWVALGALGALAFTSEFSSDTRKLKDLRQELENLEHYRGNADTVPLLDFLLWGSPEAWDADIANKKKDIENLIAGMKAQREAAAAAAKAEADKNEASAKAREAARLAAQFLRDDDAKKTAALKAEAKLLAELSGLSGDFAEKWADLSAVYAKGKINTEQLTKAQADLLAKQPAMKAAAEAAAKAEQDAAKFTKDYSEGLELLSKAQDKTIEDAIKEAEKNEELARTFGMTKGAIEQLELARLEEQLAQRASTGLTVDEITQLEKLIAAKKRSATAATTLDQMEVAKKAADDAKAEWKRAAESIENSLTDALMRGFESGKSFGRNLMDTLKNMFKTLILRPIISAVVNPVAGAIAGGMGASGAANAATGGATSAAGGMLGIGGVGSFGIGASYGMQSLFANGLGGTLSAGSSMIGAGSLSAGFGTIVGALAPIALGIAAAVAIWKKLDTSGTYHTGGASSASSAGVSTIRAESLGFEATRTNADTEKMTAGLVTGIVGILDSTALAFGKTAGYTAATAFADDTSKDGAWGALLIGKLGETIINWQDTKTGDWAPKVFADGAAGQTEYLAAMSASVRTALDGIGLPSWAQTMLDGLGDAPAIEDIAKVVDNINITQRALVIMGDRLTGFANLSDDAASKLIAASGGIASLAGNASTYYDNLYSEGEKAAAGFKQVSEALAAVGLAMPATREAYRDQVEAQMALGAAGAPTVAILLREAGAFSQLHAAIEPVIGSAVTLSMALKDLKDAQKNYDSALSSAQSAIATAATQYKAFVDAVVTAQTNLTDARTKITDQYRSAMDAEKAAQKSVVEARSEIATGYISASDKVAAAQKTITGLNQTMADSMYKLGGKMADFLTLMETTDIAGASEANQMAALEAQFTLKSAAARAGDTNAADDLPEIAKSLLKVKKEYSTDAVSFARTAARIRGVFVDIQNAADAKLNTLTPGLQVDPMDQAKEALALAQAEQKKWADAVTASGASLTKSSADILAGYTAAVVSQQQASAATAYWADVAAKTGTDLSDTKSEMVTLGESLIKGFFDAKLALEIAQIELVAANAIRSDLDLRQASALEAFTASIVNVNQTAAAAVAAAGVLFTAAGNKLLEGFDLATLAQQNARDGMTYWGGVVATTAAGIAASVGAMATAAADIAAATAANAAAAAAALSATSANENMVRGWYANNSQFQSNGTTLTSAEVSYWTGALATMSAADVKEQFAIAAARDAGFSTPLDVNSFDVGTNYVPYDQTARIHAGEEITPRPYVDIQRAARDGTNELLGRLVASNDELNKEVAALRAEQRAGDAANVSATKEQTRLLRDVTDEGTALITTPAT